MTRHGVRSEEADCLVGHPPVIAGLVLLAGGAAAGVFGPFSGSGRDP